MVLTTQQIVQHLPAKACTCDALLAPEEIGGSWEQFHDSLLPNTARKWCPTGKAMSHKKFPEKETYIGNVVILRNSCLSMGSCEKLYIL